MKITQALMLLYFQRSGEEVLKLKRKGGFSTKTEAAGKVCCCYKHTSDITHAIQPQ